MGDWSLRELEQMDETLWRVYLSTRLDRLDDATKGLPGRCKARAWHGPALKGILGTVILSLLGAVSWFIVKVWG